LAELKFENDTQRFYPVHFWVSVNNSKYFGLNKYLHGGLDQAAMPFLTVLNP
jgi:hypothetical protein